MRVKIQLVRSANLTGNRGADFALKHPLGGLAMASCFDSRGTVTPPPSVYADLRGLSLPSGAGTLPANALSYAIQGLCIVGPNGAVPFTVISAQHRVQAACTYHIPVEWPGPPPTLTYSLASVMNSALWFRNPFDQHFFGATRAYEKITGGSVFANPDGYYVAPENNSFSTANASELNVPGYTTVERYSNEEEITTDIIACINEAIRYRQTAKGVGRMIGYGNMMLNYTAMENFWQTNVIGTFVQQSTTGLINSLWEIEIAEDILAATAGLSGQLYAIAAGNVPGVWMACEEFVGGTSTFNMLGSVSATPYFDSGIPNYLYVNLTNPGGTNVSVQNVGYSQAYNQVGGAVSSALGTVVSTLGIQSVSDIGVAKITY